MSRSIDLIVQQKNISKILKSFKSNYVANREMYPHIIQRILKYIYSHLFEKSLSVEKVKRDCLLTNNNITTSFRIEIGVGICQYIARERMKAAALVLRESNVDIYLIADAIGYSNEYFSKLFKKEYGITPSEYRYKMTGYVKRKDKKKDKEI